MKWILFVLLTGDVPLYTQEFNSAQTCADAAIELEKRAKGQFVRHIQAWCMPMDAREKPNGKKSSWM